MDISRFVLDGQSTPWVSVSLERTPACNLHTGLVWRDADSKLHRLHFGWHRALYSDPYTTVACSIPELDDADGMFVAGFFGRISRNAANKAIPYNLKYDADVFFDQLTGTVRFGAHSTGLGCATFVLAAFRSCGNPLVDFQDWPAPTDEDIAMQKIFVSMLKRSSDPDKRQQGAKIETEVGCKRIRPEHSAGACLEDQYPVRYDFCERNGVAVVEKLDGVQPDQKPAVEANDDAQSAGDACDEFGA